MQKNTSIEVQNRSDLLKNQQVSNSLTLKKPVSDKKVFKNSAAATINSIIDMQKLKKLRQPLDNIKEMNPPKKFEED